MLRGSQSLAEDDFDLGIENGRRESNIGNDDDYDYALELLEDEEYRLTAQAMQEVKDFPDEITGKTYSPVRPATETAKVSVFSNLVSYGKKRLSMVTGGYPKSPDTEAGKTAISSADFLPATPEEQRKKSRRSSLSSLFSKKSNSPATHMSPSSRLNYMERGGAIEEEKPECASDDENEQQMQFDDDNDRIGLSEYGENGATINLQGGEENNEGEVVSKKIFKAQLKELNKRKKWAENAVRRTSNNFMSNYNKSGKAAMDLFIVTMSRGVLVRRHQAGCAAEEVRLFSDDGCHSINWEPPKNEKNSPPEAPTTLLGMGAASLHDGSAFDCCITVCGCGDNLQDAQDLSRMNNRDTYKNDDENNEDGTRRYRGFWSAIRYRRHGSIMDSNFVAIQPATSDDPTRPGYIGTHAFRSSKDAYNEAFSFSVVSSLPLGGVSTLDIECQTEQDYFVLLSGFLMLCTEAHLRYSEQKQQKKQEKLERADSKVSETWEKYQASLFPPEAKKLDPIDALFYVSSGLMLPLKFNTVIKPGDEDKKYEYDVIPPSQFLGWKSAGTQIWARLRLAGLEVKCVFSWDLRRVILKLKCPQWRLEEVAEKMHMKLKKRDGTFKRFKRSRRGTFVAAGFNGSIFRSSERQRIIDFILRSKIVDGGAELDEDTRLGQCIKSRFPLHMHERLDMLKHSWVTFWKIEQPGEIATPWSVLEVPFMVTVKRVWTSAQWTWDGLLSQPLDSIAEYYGEDVAFYFAWMSFFSRWLVLPSILGFVVFCAQVHERKLDHWLCLPYAVIIIMWSCVLLAFWRQKAATLAHRWGVLDHEVEETERPQFKGKYTYDPNLGEVRKLYPSWRRFLKYCVSYPIILFFVGSVLILMIVTSTTNEQLSSQYDNGEELDYSPRVRASFGLASTGTSSTTTETPEDTVDGDNDKNSLSNLRDIQYWVVNLIYPSIYGLITNVAAEIFEMLAVALTGYENHQTESNYWNQLIIKVFSVRFVTVFTSIFYYAFRSGLDSETSYKLMSLSIFAFITVGDWWGKFIQICVPSWLQRFKLYRMKAAVVTLRKHMWKMRAQEVGGDSGLYMMARRQHYLSQSQEQCWQESLKKDYTTFGDYTRLMIQLGFVLFFAAVFPLSPLIVLINNIFFIRLDAFKLTNTRKRPIAQKSAGLGVWEDILQVMSVAGIITNCCIVGITSAVLPRWMRAYGTVGVAISLFFFEHIMLLFKYMLHKAIPRIPITVQREIIGIVPNDSGNKSKAPLAKKKKRPKYVKEFNLHEDDNYNDDSFQPEEDSHLHDDNRVDLCLEGEGDVDLMKPAIEEGIVSMKRDSAPSHVRSIADDLCSELSDDIENSYRGSEANSRVSDGRLSHHTINSERRNPESLSPVSGVRERVRRRSSIRKMPPPSQHNAGSNVQTSKTLSKMPLPRRSALLYKKNHPLEDIESEDNNMSESDDSSSHDDISVTRLKMKIQALKRRGKKIKGDGSKSSGISMSRSQSIDDEESPTTRARRRVAQSSRIPFEKYPAHAIMRSNSFTAVNFNTEPDVEPNQSQTNEPIRKKSSVMDPSTFISFLQRRTRSGSKESDTDNNEAGCLTREGGADVELAQLSPSSRSPVLQDADEHRDRVSISNLPTTEISRDQRSKSIATSAWDFVRGIGFSRPSQAENSNLPVEQVVMEQRGSPQHSTRHRTPSNSEIESARPEQLPTYKESQQMKIVRSPERKGESSSPERHNPTHHREVTNNSRPSATTGKQNSEVSPTLSAIKGKGTVRNVASAINSKSPAVIAQQRQAEAYKAHIGRNRNMTPSRTTTVKNNAPPVHSASPMPKVTKRTQKSEPRKASNHEEQRIAARSKQNPAETSAYHNEWESIPESACFISRLKEKSGKKRQSMVDSPFMSIVNSASDHDDTYEESPSHKHAEPIDSRCEYSSPARGNLKHEYDENDYEPSPVEEDLSQYINQYSEDYDDEYEASPLSDRGGRKSVMRGRRVSMAMQENINCYQRTPQSTNFVEEDDDVYEESPPSPPRPYRTINDQQQLNGQRSRKSQHYTLPARDRHHSPVPKVPIR